VSERQGTVAGSRDAGPSRRGPHVGGAVRWGSRVCAVGVVLLLAATGSSTAVGGRSAAAQAGTWTVLAALPEPRLEGGAVALNGRIYVIGGYNSASSQGTQPDGAVYVYDLATNRWSSGTPLPEMLHHMGVAVLNGKIYSVGGERNNFFARSAVDSVWEYDPATDRWQSRAPMPTPRGAMAVAVLDGRLYAIGGERQRGARPGYDPLDEVAAYDPQTDTWEMLAPMRFPREHLMAGAANGRVYAIGGRYRPAYTLPFVEEYDPTTRTWTERDPMPTGRSGGTAAVVDNVIYVFGGEGDLENPDGVFPQVEAFDPAANAWLQLERMPMPRHSMPAVAIGNRIYLPGGNTRLGGHPDGPGSTAYFDVFEVT
jgi:N-acetylneuraminic acid mutarotase